MTPYIHIIVNPAAGGGAPDLNAFQRYFRDHPMAWDVSITQEDRPGDALARQAAEAGAQWVAACGGDGTVMAVANGLEGTGVPLVILPCGTGNAMAVNLSIPLNLQAALALLEPGTHRFQTLDMGQIGQRRFLLRASVGMEADISAQASRDMRDRFGIIAYVIAGTRLLTDPQMVQYRLTLDGEPVECEGFTLLIANMRDIGRLGLAFPDAVAPDDGLLDVIVIDTALTLAASVTSLDELVGAIPHWQAREIAIEADQPQGYQADGEWLGQTPVTARVLPSAIEVLVPDDA